MTSVPRDPAFWKRFSYAVHMDEEKAPEQLKESDSWLARQQRKRSRRASYICCAFWLCFFLFIAGVVAVIIWLLKSGVLDNVKIGDKNGTTYQPADPNSDVSKRDGAEKAGEAVMGLVRRGFGLRYRES
ncbi:hypothetical protein LTR85_003538 [Meristemomyces frigidus]|nr:hypothetical protein LTR85_003538 [Meristemomyces frigidus]